MNPLYFVDETDVGLGRVLALAKVPVVHPGHPNLPEVPLETEDPDWMPIIAARGLVVITRDKFRRRSEWEMYKAENLRVIRIEARVDLTPWDTVRLVAYAWERIEAQRRTGGPGPWLASIDSAGVLKVRNP